VPFAERFEHPGNDACVTLVIDLGEVQPTSRMRVQEDDLLISTQK
jgi:hypothetical protein